jgi:hypothetical protein
MDQPNMQQQDDITDQAAIQCSINIILPQHQESSNVQCGHKTRNMCPVSLRLASLNPSLCAQSTSPAQVQECFQWQFWCSTLRYIPTASWWMPPPG